MPYVVDDKIRSDRLKVLIKNCCDTTIIMETKKYIKGLEHEPNYLTDAFDEFLEINNENLNDYNISSLDIIFEDKLTML